MKRSQNVGSGTAEMVKRRPIRALPAQFCGQNGKGMRLFDNGSDPLLHLVAVAVGDAAITGPRPDTGLRIQLIVKRIKREFHDLIDDRLSGSRLRGAF